MSNFTKDQPSIRVFAPPGGRSANIFGVPEPEPPMSTKKNHMESDIFGCKKDNTDSVTVKQTRNVTNNIFGTEPEQPVQKSNTYSDKNKSTIFDEAPPQQPSNTYSDKNKSTIFDEAPPQQPSNKPDRQRSNIFSTNEPDRQRSNEPDRQRSTIFSTNEPDRQRINEHDRQRSDIFGTNELAQSAPTRPVSEKHKSNIFGIGDDNTQTKRQQGTRQGLRDPNASRMGYNPINGESYSTKDGLNSKAEQAETIENEKESDDTVKTPEEENGEQGENGDAQTPTDTAENGNSEASVDKPANGHTNGTNGHSTAKNSHTGVRVFQPPGGRSNGPLW